MAVIYCQADDVYIDLDYNVEHLDECGSCNPDLGLEEEPADKRDDGVIFIVSPTKS